MTICDRYGAEWAALEIVCAGLDREENRQQFIGLLGVNEFDWGRLMEQAVRHKVYQLVSFHLLSESTSGLIPNMIRQHLQLTVDVSKHKSIIFRREAATVSNALAREGIEHVATKGIVLDSDLYGATGTRYLWDIDFMILPEDRQKTSDVLSDLGYENGNYDWRRGKIVPLDRKDEITYRVSPDHLPPFVKLTGDPVYASVAVDVANSLTWSQSAFDVKVADAFQQKSYSLMPGAPDDKISCMSVCYHFIFILLHLFREAWFPRWLGMDQDVSLSKFCDVVRFYNRYRRDLRRASFLELISKHGINNPLYWVLEHTDRMFNTDSVKSLSLESFGDEEWLHSAYGPAGEIRGWKGTMRDRLFCRNRERCFE